MIRYDTTSYFSYTQMLTLDTVDCVVYRTGPDLTESLVHSCLRLRTLIYLLLLAHRGYGPRGASLNLHVAAAIWGPTVSVRVSRV